MQSASKARRTKPRRFNLKEVLGETRDTLGLMLDLAYSTILFEEDHFGQEVMELEERMGELIFTARSAVMLGAKGADEIAALTGVLKIVTAAEKIGDSASDIAEIRLVGIGLPKRFIKTLHLMEDTLARVTLSEESEVIGTSIASIESKTGMTVVALRSGSKWSINPDNEELLKAGDTRDPIIAPRLPPRPTTAGTSMNNAGDLNNNSCPVVNIKPENIPTKARIISNGPMTLTIVTALHPIITLL